MLEHFPASDLQNGSSVWGSRGHARRVHTCVVGPGPEGFEDLGSLKETVEDAQVAAALTLENEIRFLHLFLCSTGMEFLGIQRGSIVAMPDLLRSNNGFFSVFSTNISCTSSPDRSPL